MPLACDATPRTGRDVDRVVADPEPRHVVSITAGGNDLSVAEYTAMLLLAVARRTVEMDAAARAGHWTRPEGRPMRELAGRVVLVVGYGGIGSRVARLCAAFGMHVMTMITR
jgi:D-3-phosphoglycerate dehydrogenase